ncbi:4Fe-4S binding protein [Phosphitispora fastidiosa]|uniref:4Fe-4S binding protein n=1 Tax=Phosphitispora fastidiosa TaxID=2837202 RepID=UPI001E36D219|nr:4Fe-4S binding protein [Phosphitispora fastidiosa]MBU7007683.1 2-oxoglutarate ferredoxin oxidoreductase subunit delta [Phosphitispora fastidiosa]
MAKGRAIICEDRCKGCGLCVTACPQRLIEISNKLNVSGFHPAVVTDYEKCKGCALCALMCPDVAIEVEREEK